MNSKHYAVVGLTLLCAASPASADLTISNKPTQNVTCSGGVCTETAAKAVLNVDDLTALLSSGNATVASGSMAKDIKIDAGVSWKSASRLTLDAYHSIAFDKPLNVGGNGALTITTNDGGVDGDFCFFGKGHVEFRRSTTGLIIDGAHYNVVDTLQQLQTQIHKDPTRNFALAKSINAIGQTYTESIIPGLGTVFEGLGNTISNLTINASATPVGFFGKVALTGVVRDVGLLSVTVEGSGGTQGMGALVGLLNDGGEVLNSFATGQVSGSGIVGGLVGYNQSGEIYNSYAKVTVTGNGLIGGLAGETENSCATCDNGVFGTIDGSYATGPVSGGDASMVGGLVGQNHGGTVSHAYATGAVSGGNNAFVGGLVGTNSNWAQQQTKGKLGSTYATGAPTGGTGTLVGGLIGQDLAQVLNSYWDLDTSGISDPSQGAGNVPNDQGIAGLTTEQFQSGLPVNFSRNIWKEKASINSGYPYLIDNAPQ